MHTISPNSIPPNLPPTPNSLESHLEKADAGRIIPHARLLSRLSHIYQATVPFHLGQMSRLVNYKSGKIIVHTANHATAAKLRQLAPTLTDCFSKQGFECNGLQVKTQPVETEKKRIFPQQKPLNREVFGKIEQLYANLPESSLRMALGNLLSHAAQSEPQSHVRDPETA
ncbi:MAG: flagellar hook-length control protein FliK [Candidatus Accumulibacter sp.]|jgi:hypothetical protein|nr:flagellar hook-length control protein FliK [Accumulibacter sp.]